MAVDFTDLKDELRKRDYIPFSRQFLECEKAGINKQTRFYAFEHHPDLLPAFPWRSNLQKLVAAIKSGECAGMTFHVCSKFGGVCSGGNNPCRVLRGLEPHTDNRQDKFNFNYYETEEAYRASKGQENQPPTPQL